MASGMSTTMRFSAIMLTIGVFGALLAGHAEQLLQASLTAQAAPWLDQTRAIASRGGAGDMPAAMATLPESARPAVQPLARAAFVGGFGTVLWVAGWLAMSGALVVGRLMRHPLPVSRSYSLARE